MIKVLVHPILERWVIGILNYHTNHVCKGSKSDTTGLYWCGLTFTNMPINNTIPKGDYKNPGCKMSSELMLELGIVFLQNTGYCIFKSLPKKTYSFASSMLLFQYSSLLVPPPHIIKHIIITWLSACVSLRSILALPGNQFVVTLCNPSKVIKWNELQLQRAFKNTGEKEKKKMNARKMTTQPRNIPPLDSTSQVLKMKY